MHLEHIGIAADDADAVLGLYRTLLGARPYKEETIAQDGVRTHFLAAGAAKLEVLEAVSEDSPVARFLERRGEGVHHLAFEVDGIDQAMQRLRAEGFTPLTDAPYPGADGKRVFFLHPKDTHGVLVEFCQQRRAPLDPVRVPYRGGHLAAYEAGRAHPERPPLLLLHGAAGCTALETAPLLRRMARRRRVLALDFAAHGASADPGEPFSAEFFADNVRAALDHFGAEQADLFGFSMGGYVALHFARQHPERVRRAAVHGACVRWDEALTRAMNARLDAAALAQRSPLAVQRMEAAHGEWRTLFRRTRDFVRTLPARSAAFEDELRRVACPVLVSAVDEDDLFPLEAPMRVHRLLPGGRLALLPGRHHALQRLPLRLYAPLLHRHLAGHG